LKFYALFAMRRCKMVLNPGRAEGAFMNPKSSCYFDNRRHAGMCAGSADSCDQGGRSKGLRNNQRRQGQNQAFCDIGQIGDQMEQANAKNESKKVEELSLKADELEKQLGPEYAAMVDGIQNVDPESEVGPEIRARIQALDKLCTK
jgi:hypothetical protein